MSTNNKARSHRSRALRVASIAMVAGLIPALMPAPSQAFGTVRLSMANVSAPITFAERSFEIRVGVQSTCTPVVGTHVGECSNVELAVTWWGDGVAPATDQDSISFLGGIGIFHVPAQDVRPSTLHFRVTASQTWRPVACGEPNVPRCVRQSGRAERSGQTMVLNPL